MRNLILVKDYQSPLDVIETQKAIKLIKNTFEMFLAEKLELERVSAPIIVDPLTGLNDNLSGVEKAISFKNGDKELEIVQSLAKWKRYALRKYNLKGIYTDMNAIRPCEETDNLHSLYVDQWDWEKVIEKEEDRNLDYLKDIVNKIYTALQLTEMIITKSYPEVSISLADHVTFITSQELLDLYPNLSPREREYEFTKEHKSVFIIGIGAPLSDGQRHDSRASDYDDWALNGDLLIWDEVINAPMEISSMGIRVNKDSLKRQLEISGEHFKLDYEYHQLVINDKLPLTIGGGIGQSRLCMLLLKKAHIGEVQSSYWSEEDTDIFKKLNIHLL